jgi:hypothetical protein
MPEASMPENEEALLRRLDAFVQKVAQRDISLVDELWGDGGFVMVGSEKGEICRTRAEVEARLKAVFAYPATLIFDWPQPKTTVVGSVAWIFAEGDLILRGAGMEDVRRPYLASCIFENRDGKWHWRQYFGSEPV